MVNKPHDSPPPSNTYQDRIARTDKKYVAFWIPADELNKFVSFLESIQSTPKTRKKVKLSKGIRDALAYYIKQYDSLAKEASLLTEITDLKQTLQTLVADFATLQQAPTQKVGEPDLNFARTLVATMKVNPSLVIDHHEIASELGKESWEIFRDLTTYAEEYGDITYGVDKKWHLLPAP